MKPPRWVYTHSRLLFAASDAVLLVLALVIAVWIRFDGRVPPVTLGVLPKAILLSVLVKITVFWALRLYDLSWSQVGLEDMLLVFRAVTAGSVVFGAAAMALQAAGRMANVPRGVVLVDYVLTLYLLGALRLGRRVAAHLRQDTSAGRTAIIVGAGAAGTQLLRSLRQTPDSGYNPVGFIDDDPTKIGTLIHGLPVLGGRDALSAITRARGIEAVLIALPSASSRVVRHVVSLSRQAGVQEVRIVPGIERVLGGQVGLTDLRDVEVADLLTREVVRIDTAQVGEWLRGRVVLVTGAGGSIGSELSRQIARFGPRELVLLDQDESGVFSTEHEIRRPGLRVATVVADVRDGRRISRLFQEIRPDVVFHAAAYKHVGMMERFPDAAVLINIFGTLSVAEASVANGVEGFVLISTDKAVNPASVMGVTKRVAEQICRVLQEQGPTRFVAVRFGNVLGSRGSVIPLFQDKIRRGEPLTIRGPNMQRYFMAISEAVLLVLQAGAMGRGSETFVLDMGEPIKILDLARDLIRMHGLEPERDVPIVFADPEPGEKDAEDLLTAEEGTVATKQDRIFVVKASAVPDADAFFAHLERLYAAAEAGDRAQLYQTLQTLVPTYRPSAVPAAEVSPLA